MLKIIRAYYTHAYLQQTSASLYHCSYFLVNSSTDAIIDSTINNNISANTDPSVLHTNNTPAPTPTVILEPESSTLLYVDVIVMVSW